MRVSAISAVHVLNSVTEKACCEVMVVKQRRQKQGKRVVCRVITRGSDHRGARRVLAGSEGLVRVGNVWRRLRVVYGCGSRNAG